MLIMTFLYRVGDTAEDPVNTLLMLGFVGPFTRQHLLQHPDNFFLQVLITTLDDAECKKVGKVFNLIQLEGFIIMESTQAQVHHRKRRWIDIVAMFLISPTDLKLPPPIHT